MRISWMLFPLLLLLVLSAEFSPVMAVQAVQSVRIPEHTCHKQIASNKCELQKCVQECSKEPNGVGECRDTICWCTYYCKEPPQ